MQGDELTALYRGEKITRLYALDTESYAAARYLPTTSAVKQNELVAQLAQRTAGGAQTKRAFLLLTGQNRYYIYLDDQAPEALTTAWKSIYDNAKSRNLHWLVHMTADRIAKVGSVTDRAAIDRFAAFLKDGLKATATNDVFSGADNPVTVAGLYHIRITFDSGVTYTLIGCGDYDKVDAGGSAMTLYTSDLDRTVQYTLEEGAAAQLRRQLDALNKAANTSRATTANIILLPVPATQNHYEDMSVAAQFANRSGQDVQVTTRFAIQRLGADNRWVDVSSDKQHSETWNLGAAQTLDVDVLFAVEERRPQGRYRIAFTVMPSNEDDAFETYLSFTVA